MILRIHGSHESYGSIGSCVSLDPMDPVVPTDPTDLQNPIISWILWISWIRRNHRIHRILCFHGSCGSCGSYGSPEASVTRSLRGRRRTPQWWQTCQSAEYPSHKAVESYTLFAKASCTEQITRQKTCQSTQTCTFTALVPRVPNQTQNTIA